MRTIKEFLGEAENKKAVELDGKLSKFFGKGRGKIKGTMIYYKRDSIGTFSTANLIELSKIIKPYNALISVTAKGEMVFSI